VAQLEARKAHILQVTGSSPVPATKFCFHKELSKMMERSAIKYVAFAFIVSFFVGTVVGYNFKKCQDCNKLVIQEKHSEIIDTNIIPQSPVNFEVKKKISYVKKSETDYPNLDSLLTNDNLTSNTFSNPCDSSKICKVVQDTIIDNDTFNITTYFKAILCSNDFVTVFNWQRSPKEIITKHITDSIPYQVTIEQRRLGFGLNVGYGFTGFLENDVFKIKSGLQVGVCAYYRIY
jgi:hypothetical protein